MCCSVFIQDMEESVPSGLLGAPSSVIAHPSLREAARERVAMLLKPTRAASKVRRQRGGGRRARCARP